MAILGVTYQYITTRIDRDKYDLYQSLFLDEVVRLNHEPLTSRIPNPDDRSISKSDELRFMLFRHWNLYDAMLHSGYVAGRMGIWKEKGRKRLQGLLAKMGYVFFLALDNDRDLAVERRTLTVNDRFSLQQCQQGYAHMDMDLKRNLRDKLETIAPEYGLVELSYPSFTRTFGFQLSLSAADAVEGLSALLEAARGVKLEIEVEGGRGGGEWFGGSRIWNVGGREDKGGNGGSGGEEDKENRNRGRAGAEVVEIPDTQEKKKESNWYVGNFWIAYDACEE